MCIERIKAEEHREKPQVRSLLRGRNIGALAWAILGKLGEKDPNLMLNVRKHRCLNRDVAVYILYQLGVYQNEEIGKAFGVGYTAVTGAVKRGYEYLQGDQQLERTVERIISDI